MRRRAGVRNERQTEQIGFRQWHGQRGRRGGSCERGPQVCRRRQETLAHSLITQLKRTGNVPPVPCRPLPSLLFHRRYSAMIIASPPQLCRSDVTRGRPSAFKPRPFIDISCTQHHPTLSYWELVLIDALCCARLGRSAEISITAQNNSFHSAAFPHSRPHSPVQNFNPAHRAIKNRIDEKKFTAQGDLFRRGGSVRVPRY